MYPKQTSPKALFIAAVRPRGLDLFYTLGWCILLLSLVLLPTFFHEFNVLGGSELLASTVGQLLTSIDKLQYTATVVTFLFWCIVGLVVYGFVSSLVRALVNAEETYAHVTEKYIRPAYVSRAIYWRLELQRSVITIVTMSLIAGVVALTAFSLLPAASVRLRALVVDFQAGDVVAALASSVLLLGGVFMLVLCCKAWRYRRFLYKPF